MLEEQLRELVIESPSTLYLLKAVRSLHLPQGYIAAGAIRSLVWDQLHGFPHRDFYEDIDVVYYNRADLSDETDLILEQQLMNRTGSSKWSVRNQARMHLRNGEQPYTSVEDAMSRWPETATAIGARVDDDGLIQLCAPLGLDDLFSLKVRQSPLFRDRQHYLERIAKKGWQEKWPLLTIT
ncbi:nucleotidyltransferase family protein [Paenibacillus sp. GCM10023252]|uniref:nucleotidyltransferase family protein n=1 Tax=Paenibacillus sp. GCM10023252 TaxID=3252649 RepID=UPI00361BE592